MSDEAKITSVKYEGVEIKPTDLVEFTMPEPTEIQLQLREMRERMERDLIASLGIPPWAFGEQAVSDPTGLTDRDVLAVVPTLLRRAGMDDYAEYLERRLAHTTSRPEIERQVAMASPPEQHLFANRELRDLAQYSSWADTRSQNLLRWLDTHRAEMHMQWDEKNRSHILRLVVGTWASQQHLSAAAVDLHRMDFRNVVADAWRRAAEDIWQRWMEIESGRPEIPADVVPL